MGDGIARAGAVKPRTGSSFFRQRFLNRKLWILIVSICLPGVVACLLLSWSFRSDLTPSQRESKAPLHSNVPFSESGGDEDVIERPTDQEPTVSPLPETDVSEIEDGSGNVGSAPFDIETVSRPLVLFEPAPESKWRDEQVQRLDVLRNEFVKALGGWNQDPNGADYRERWNRSQPLIDERFETIFGSEAFSEQQIQAAHYRE